MEKVQEWDFDRLSGVSDIRSFLMSCRVGNMAVG